MSDTFLLSKLINSSIENDSKEIKSIYQDTQQEETKVKVEPMAATKEEKKSSPKKLKEVELVISQKPIEKKNIPEKVTKPAVPIESI